MALALSMGGLSGWAHADQRHPACAEPAEPYAHYSPPELRSIAASCLSPEIARLFYNRAYHADLLEHYRVLARLDRGGRGGDGGYRYETYPMFIGLAEAFARDAWKRRGEAAIRELNAGYDRAMEIAELRIRGYDPTADYLEHRLFAD
jgi:hypothetical protein